MFPTKTMRSSINRSCVCTLVHYQHRLLATPPPEYALPFRYALGNEIRVSDAGMQVQYDDVRGQGMGACDGQGHQNVQTDMCRMHGTHKPCTRGGIQREQGEEYSGKEY